ncbi:hypothetical protein EB093_09045 [bacterium]|nr:hypothetical protein [bacterium]
MTALTPIPLQDQENNLKQLVELGTLKYEYIFGGIESLETKAGTLLGFLGIIVTVAFTGSKSIFGSLFILNLISSVFFLVSGGFLLMALIVKPYRIDPEILGFAKQYLNSNTLDFNKQLIANISDSVKKNLDTLDQKSNWFNRALISLTLGVGSLLLSNFVAIIHIFCKG